MGAVFTLPYLLLVGGASLPSNPLPRRGLPCPAWITAYNYSPSPSKSVRTFLLQKSKPSATNGHHDGLGEEDDPGRRRVGGGRAGRPASRHRLPDRRCLRHPRQWPLPRLPHLLPALQGAARGVSALVAESLASIGAHVASGFRRVAGVQLSINHHRPAALGAHVLAEARPVNLGKTIHVWEVKLWKAADEGGPNQMTKGSLLLASSRVTLLVNLPVPEEARQAEEKLRKHARL